MNTVFRAAQTASCLLQPCAEAQPEGAGLSTDTATGLPAAAQGRGLNSLLENPYMLWPISPFAPSRGWLVELMECKNAGRPLTLCVKMLLQRQSING